MEVISVLKENIDVSDEKTLGDIGIKSEYAGKVFDYDPKGIE